jgi:hypothetical protein
MSAAEDPTSTGDAEVDRILGALDALGAVPVSGHAGLLLDVHDRLSSELTPEQKLHAAGAHGAP